MTTPDSRQLGHDKISAYRKRLCDLHSKLPFPAMLTAAECREWGAFKANVKMYGSDREAPEERLFRDLFDASMRECTRTFKECRMDAILQGYEVEMARLRAIESGEGVHA